ncbi:TMEM165/GDT1 family protein, partial [Modestobacter sp. KNN46-3]
MGGEVLLLVISGLAAFLGRKLADRLPVTLLHRIAAGLFLVFAVVAVVE